jgi:hypothetical protein
MIELICTGSLLKCCGCGESQVSYFLSIKPTHIAPLCSGCVEGFLHDAIHATCKDGVKRLRILEAGEDYGSDEPQELSVNLAKLVTDPAELMKSLAESSKARVLAKVDARLAAEKETEDEENANVVQA